MVDNNYFAVPGGGISNTPVASVVQPEEVKTPEAQPEEAKAPEAAPDESAAGTEIAESGDVGLETEKADAEAVEMRRMEIKHSPTRFKSSPFVNEESLPQS